MSSNQADANDSSGESSFSEDDEEVGVLDELDLGHVRRLDQENDRTRANHSAIVGIVVKFFAVLFQRL